MRRNPPAQWTLPDVVNPATRLCVQVYVPNDAAHIAAFRGALLALQSAYNWQDDAAHTAKDVALVWREIIRDMGDNWGCDTGIQTIEFRQLANCPLEVSIDGGEWTTIYDGYNCAVSAIDDAISDGVIGVPTQQPPSGEVPSQDCQSYNVQLAGNGIWHCPTPISASYSITIENAVGGWWDGDINDLIWSCPTGSDYALGACVGDPEAAQQGDPLQTAPHMRLIGHYDSTYFDAYNTSHDVPAGQDDADFFLQANDGDLSDNQGSISCKVTICNYSEWGKYWIPGDGFVISGYGELVGSEFIGTGYNDIGRNQIDAALPVTDYSVRVTRVIVYYETANGRFGIWQSAKPSFVQHDIVEPLPNGTTTYDKVVDFTYVATDNFSIKFASYSGLIKVTRLELYGTGRAYDGGNPI